MLYNEIILSGTQLKPNHDFSIFFLNINFFYIFLDCFDIMILKIKKYYFNIF